MRLACHWLSYVVREKDTPDEEVAVEYESFNEQAVACAPLTGTVFQADSRKVHQLLKSFLQAETAEQWIKPIERKLNGRQDMIVLRNHYAGEGNTSRRIAMAERIRDSLHYKNERAMPFSGFLDKLQKMFNIFEELGEPVQEQAKIRILLAKIEHPQLLSCVENLNIRVSLDGNATFTQCANFLASQVSKLPDQPQSARKVSSASTDRAKGEIKRIRGGGAADASKRNGIYMPDGSIWTGYYSDWAEMSKADRQTVMDTRVKNKGKSPAKKAGSSGAKHKAKDVGHKAQLAALKRQIAALTAKAAGKKDEHNDDDDASSGTLDNAGDCFGGRHRKQKQKNE